MKLTRRTFATGVTASAGIAVTQRALAQSTPQVSPVANDLETRLLELMEEFEVPGAVVGAILPDSPEPMYLELGVANLETNEPISTDMHFRIASVTKTYVSTVVLQLVDEDELSLDDTISSILPDLQIANADIVTVRDLLRMRSGLPQLTESFEYVDVFLTNPTQEVSFSDYVGFVAEIPAHSDPDTEFEYNNLNYNILGEMIELVTGETWAANVNTRILEPLGLTTTQMSTMPEMPSPYATGYGYMHQDIPVELIQASPAATPVTEVSTPTLLASPVSGTEAFDVTLFNPTIAGAAGGLISTVTDQLTWVQALVSGELISEESHAAQIESHPMDESGTIGYGLGIIDLGGVYGHNGAINGYQSAIVSAPDFGVHIAVLTNAHPTLGFGDAAFTLALEILS